MAQPDRQPAGQRRRQHQDGGSLVSRLAQLVGQFEAANSGHRKIENEQIGPDFLRHRDAACGIAGRQDDDYSARVGGLGWSSYFVRYGGEHQLKILMDWARERYDHILIDSRTGVADTAGICTTLLPDALVVCFVYNRQSIEGSAAVARSILENRKTREMPQISITFSTPVGESANNLTWPITVT